MSNNNIYYKKLKDIANDNINLTTKLDYEFIEDSNLTTNKNSSFINDKEYDAVTPYSNRVDIRKLTKKQIQEIAENTLQTEDEKYPTEKAVVRTLETAYYEIQDMLSSIKTAGNAVDAIIQTGTNIRDGAKNMFSGLFDSVSSILDAQGLESLSSITGSLSDIIQQNMSDYQDGIKETSFGTLMESSWAGNTNKSFLNYFSNRYSSITKESRRINILNSTPLDSGDSRNSLFGTMILGTPYTFNSVSDPMNRTLINSFVKDGRILSLTPGMPKYNGLTSYAKIQDSILNQTDTPDEMLSYLLRNGLDSTFSSKDKRYYTFEAKYEDYFAYLETMLNAIWIKLGLSKNGEQFNLFSFFNIKNDNNGGIDASGHTDLKPQYNSSIGFFTNIASRVSESIDSQKTGFGADLANTASSNSDDYQRLNYITGMGTGGAGKNLSRSIGITSSAISQFKDLGRSIFKNTSEGSYSFDNLGSSIASIAKLGLNVTKDIVEFTNTQDIGAVMQSFATSNGMKVVYPELWSDSSYSKNINFDFTFTSPYGDPLSIFKYVYVPFMALACFSLPRQAAENGYVSPFFVRADVPGLMTSDLAMITSFTWVKGGSQALWTKDGLPRSIECSITISDLYEYLSMTKRLSFLSANPSYTVFLDNMTGMCSLHDDSEDDALNIYFKNLIDRVNGISVTNSDLWNKFNSAKSSEVFRTANGLRGSLSSGLGKYSIPWLHNSSI